MYGGKTSEIRTMNTNKRERIAIYASWTEPSKRDLAWLDEYGPEGMFYEVCSNVDPFPRGVILGTVELFECNKIESKESFEANIDCHMNDPDWFKNGMYSWELAKPRTNRSD